MNTVYGKIESSKCAFLPNFEDDAAMCKEVDFPSPHPCLGRPNEVSPTEELESPLRDFKIEEDGRLLISRGVVGDSNKGFD